MRMFSLLILFSLLALAQSDCNTCDSNQYCHQNACADLKNCIAGEYVSKNATDTSNRECTPCTNGFTTVNNTLECQGFQDCDKGVLVFGNVTTDNVCKKGQGIGTLAAMILIPLFGGILLVLLVGWCVYAQTRKSGGYYTETLLSKY